MTNNVDIFYDGGAFVGHSGIIQRNALKSWKLLHPEVEVILFGEGGWRKSASSWDCGMSRVWRVMNPV